MRSRRTRQRRENIKREMLTAVEVKRIDEEKNECLVKSGGGEKM